MFILTNHAKKRMVERGIKLQDIKRAFERPDQASKDFDGKLILKKKFDSKTIEIVYTIRGDKIFIITCYFL